jgi:CRP-like cAMP-binding protein
MLNWFGRDVAAAENHHHSFCLKNTRERVAEALHILALKCGLEKERGVLIPIRMMRTDWAEWIGIAKENLIRCFSEFKREGLIDQDGDFILVLDMRKISAIAALEPAVDDIYHLQQ